LRLSQAFDLAAASGPRAANDQQAEQARSDGAPHDRDELDELGLIDDGSQVHERVGHYHTKRAFQRVRGERESGAAPTEIGEKVAFLDELPELVYKPPFQVLIKAPR
jgi:hypothetical protein